MIARFPKKIGILGGGQLARMLATRCYSLGLLPFVFCKSKTDSAAQVVSDLFHDSGRVESLLDFASHVDLIIIENEFVNLDHLQAVAQKVSVLPSVESLGKVQNKYHQKVNLKEYKIPIADFVQVEKPADVDLAVTRLGSRLVLKSATMGYDGKGTIFYDAEKISAVRFFNQNPQFNGYAESFVDFKKELAVVVARDLFGNTECFPLVETCQKNGICHWVKRPAVNPTVEKKAFAIAKKVINAFQGTGVFGIEMFLTAKNEVLVNEIAPRVHNSGHITMNACNIDQFEQHLRAVTGLKLAKPQWTSKGAAMVNIIGARETLDLHFDYGEMTENSFVYWYGKKGHSLNRKLGHINIIGNKTEECLKQAFDLRESLNI